MEYETLKREVSKELLDELKKEELFKDKLLPDILAGDVFPAIRKNRVDFYYYNSRLFEYDGTFKTHHKFAFVPEHYKTGSVGENDNTQKVGSFYKGYENIKERAKLYSSVESMGVYDICKSGNVYNKDYVTLDIEVAFTRQDNSEDEPEGTITQIEPDNNIKKEKKQNRIDILLYNLQERNLKFVEAKHFINKEIRSTGKPAVVEQISRYNKIIKEKSSDIISAYSKYVEDINQLLDIQLPVPESLSQECGLIIFGFDDDQKSGKLEESIISNLKQYDIKVYAKGSTKKIDVETIYKNT